MLYRRTSVWKGLLFNAIAIILVGVGVGTGVVIAEPISEENLGHKGGVELGDGMSSFPLSSVFYLILQDINEQIVMMEQDPDGQSETSEPSYTITEDDKEVKIKMCTTNPEEPSKQICVTIIIDKATSLTRVIIDGYTILPITLLIKCDASGKCVFKDALWTKFCTIEEQPDGKVVWNCAIDYFGVKFKGKIFLYVKDGQICFQSQKPDGQLLEPQCSPLENIPSDLKDLWKRLKLPYLPDYQEPPIPPVVLPPCLVPSEDKPQLIPVPGQGQNGDKPGVEEDTEDDFFPGMCNPYYPYPFEL